MALAYWFVPPNRHTSMKSAIFKTCTIYLDTRVNGYEKNASKKLSCYYASFITKLITNLYYCYSLIIKKLNNIKHEFVRNFVIRQCNEILIVCRHFYRTYFTIKKLNNIKHKFARNFVI